MSFMTRLRETQANEEQRKIAEEQAALFKEFIKDYPGDPLWPIVAAMQAEHAKPVWNGQHGDAIAEVVNNPGNQGTALVWNRCLSDGPYPFLSVQSVARPVPVLHNIAPSHVLDEILSMVQDINSYDAGKLSAKLVEMAFTAFKELLVTSIDADPEENTYLIQAYTKDRAWLLDIQLRYNVVYTGYQQGLPE
jgi:hypothetical protein